MGNQDDCRALLKEYFRRTRMTYVEFAVAIGYSRSYVTNVLNGNEKISAKFLELAVEKFAEYKVLKNRGEGSQLFVLAGVDIHPDYWKRQAFAELKNVDHPTPVGFVEQPQVLVTDTRQASDKPDAMPDKSQEQPTPALSHTPLVTQSSGNINLQSSLQASPTQTRRPSHKWAIVLSVTLVMALVAGSSFIVWGLFHKAPSLPAVSWGTARALTCDDLFNPSAQISTTNIANCTQISGGHVTLTFSKLQYGSPELDVKEGRGPSGPTYRVTLLMNLSPATGVPQIAGCVVVDTRPNEDIGEAVCVHNNGLIEVLNAATMCTGCPWQHLEDGEVTINDMANVPVVVERVDNKLYIEVADQVIQPVNLTTAAGNIGFLVIGTQGSITMTAIELA